MSPEEIKELIDKLGQDLVSAQHKFNEYKLDIRYKIKQLQEKCKHPKRKYYPDPSGNNDSCYCCEFCGLEKKRDQDFVN